MRFPVKAAIYARVSTLDQQPENQLAELRRYVAAHGWDAAIEYVDHGVSGAKEAIRQNLFSAGLEPSRRAVPSRIGSTANANSRTSHFSEPSYCEAYRNLRVISSESAAPPAATPSTSAEAAGLRRRALALLSEFVSLRRPTSRPASNARDHRQRGRYASPLTVMHGEPSLP